MKIWINVLPTSQTRFVFLKYWERTLWNIIIKENNTPFSQFLLEGRSLISAKALTKFKTTSCHKGLRNLVSLWIKPVSKNRWLCLPSEHRVNYVWHMMLSLPTWRLVFGYLENMMLDSPIGWNFFLTWKSQQIPVTHIKFCLNAFQL